VTARALAPAVAAALLLAAGAPGMAWSAPLKVTPTTPAGITLVEVVRDEGGGQPVLLWYRPGDAAGHTLFQFDQDRPGIANCRDACAQEFKPLSVASGAKAFAKAFGDWSIVRGAGGVRQWAYQSHPLYVWTQEKRPGEVATNVALTAEGATIPDISPNLEGGPPTEKPLMPPEGWRVVRFTPAASLKLPDGIDARVVPSALAVALTDSSGMTLYTFEGDARRDGQICSSSSCEPEWIAVSAPTIAMPVGDFSIVTRGDGARQWCYRGRPLYTYSGDKLPGDVRGAGRAPRWDVAALTQDFRPPDVAVTALDGYGDVVSVHGMTLYGGYPFEHRIGGRNQRDDFTHNSYLKGKLLGPNACVEAHCLALWHPFAAPADAQPDGWWEPIVRSDGTKQWAYKGYALYTYALDTAPGDHSGQAVYDFVNPDGTPPNFQRLMFFVDLTHVKAGAGIYWNIAKP
jgi:predicted lipoprotein with Yx(FWY)xxD motif